MRRRRLSTTLAAAVAGVALFTAHHPTTARDAEARDAKRQVVVISLDGARADVVEDFLRRGVLDRKVGLGRLDGQGVVARRNITLTPSITAVSHLGIATGSTSAHNDVPANTFHAVATPITATISGFAAPIGGYRLSPLGPIPTPTAEPLWVRLRQAGKTVVTATWPGGDGADVHIAGTLVQAAKPTRTVDYTVPFGAFGGLRARGFTLSAASFTPASPTLVNQLRAAGHVSHSPARVTSRPVETIYCPMTAAPCGLTAGPNLIRYDIMVAALDTRNDGVTNYDTLVFFDGNAATPIPAAPPSLPSTGPAHVTIGGRAAPFFFEGSGNKVGTAFFVSHLAPDLSAVRFARYAASFIPRNPAALATVDDINGNVGVWGSQPDFRLGDTFASFPDAELEAMYLDQVATFTAYQTRVALRALTRNPDADLVMIYFEQPDGSGHQFTLTDPRQATTPSDNRTVGKPGTPAGAIGQDLAKVARYARHVAFAYQQANAAVEAVLKAVGSDPGGELRRDVFVVSDHGMAPFHTAVSLRDLLVQGGFDPGLLGLRASGGAANIYVNLQGRESGGTVTPPLYRSLVTRLAEFLRTVTDPNHFYNPSTQPLFTHVFTRPDSCGHPGFCVDERIGQDTGDLLVLMREGYSFDGTQAVPRLGDGERLTSVYSVPNFYGAHGHDPALPSMSAILYAAGPRLKRGHRLDAVRNIDIAPTVLHILGVTPAPTVDGQVLAEILR